MSWIVNKMRSLKEMMFGAPKIDERKVFTPWASSRHDQGPATRKYVRRCFPQSIFTKKLTPQREQFIRAVMRRLRPEQRAIAIRYDYNKGVL